MKINVFLRHKIDVTALHANAHHRRRRALPAHEAHPLNCHRCHPATLVMAAAMHRLRMLMQLSCTTMPIPSPPTDINAAAMHCLGMLIAATWVRLGHAISAPAMLRSHPGMATSGGAGGDVSGGAGPEVSKQLPWESSQTFLQVRSNVVP